MEKPRWRGRRLVFGGFRTTGRFNLARKSYGRKCPSVDTTPPAREQSPAMFVDSLKIRPATEADVLDAVFAELQPFLEPLSRKDASHAGA